MEIVEVIRAAGYRATPQRQHLLSILADGDSFDTETLKGLFLGRTRANQTTFYRMVADFRAAGLMHVISEDGKEYHSLCEEVRQGKTPSPCYELTHCHGCGRMQDRHAPQTGTHTLRSHTETHVDHCPHCPA
jgi:Fe2+ or Zn2+ uptake regulation protein